METTHEQRRQFKAVEYFEVDEKVGQSVNEDEPEIDADDKGETDEARRRWRKTIGFRQLQE